MSGINLNEFHGVRPSSPTGQALLITLIFSAIIGTYTYINFETPWVDAFVDGDYQRGYYIGLWQLSMLALPILLHSYLAIRTQTGRLIHICGAIGGLITWKLTFYPLGMGILALTGLIPDWIELWRLHIFN